MGPHFIWKMLWPVHIETDLIAISNPSEEKMFIRNVYISCGMCEKIYTGTNFKTSHMKLVFLQPM